MIEANMQSDEQPVTWIIVAGFDRARVLESVPGHGLCERDVFERVAVGVHVHAGWHTVPGVAWTGAADAFVHAVTRHLAQCHADARFSRLVLIGPGGLLAALHDTLPPRLRGLIDLMTHADLVDADPGVIQACLPGRAAFTTARSGR